MHPSPLIRLLSAFILTNAIAVAGASAADESELPPELTALISGLPDDKKAYLLEEGEGFAGTWRKLHTQLKGRSAVEIEAFVVVCRVVYRRNRRPCSGVGCAPHD